MCAHGSYDLETQQLVKPNLQQRKSERFSCPVSWSGLFGFVFMFLDFTEDEITDWEIGMLKRFDIHKGYVNGFLYM